MSTRTTGLCHTANPLIHQVKVPVPYPLRWVNSYLLEGDGGYTVIDPGIHTDEAVEVWSEVWRELGAGFGNIERIVLTHHHPDHYGLAGLFQERSCAPVFMSETAHRQAIRLWGGDRSLNRQIWQLFIRHGMDRQASDEMVPHLEGFEPLVTPQPEVRYLQPGEPCRLGDFSYATIESAGHASGHISFFRGETGDMFCGDHVLPHISPNVSYIPGVDEQPLASYLRTLEEIAAYEVETAYPGHREPFTGFGQRCRELIAHHDRRLDLMQNHLTDAPLTAYDLSLRLFGTRLSLHQMRFALSETIAHLIHLEAVGRVFRQENNATITYAAASEE